MYQQPLVTRCARPEAEMDDFEKGGLAEPGSGEQAIDGFAQPQPSARASLVTEANCVTAYGVERCCSRPGQ